MVNYFRFEKGTKLKEFRTKLKNWKVDPEGEQFRRTKRRFRRRNSALKFRRRREGSSGAGTKGTRGHHANTVTFRRWSWGGSGAGTGKGSGSRAVVQAPEPRQTGDGIKGRFFTVLGFRSDPSVPLLLGTKHIRRNEEARRLGYERASIGRIPFWHKSIEDKGDLITMILFHFPCLCFVFIATMCN